MKELLTANQIAERLHVSPRHARRLMAEMRPLNISTGSKRPTLRVCAAELDAWIRRKSAELPCEVIVPQRKPKLTLYRPTALVNGKIPYARAK